MKNKRSQKPKPQMKGEPVFTYVSDCHNVRATKVPLLNPHDMEAARETSLGTFRCGECGKRCKCARSKNNKPEAQ